MECALGPADGRHSVCGDLKKALRPSAAFRRGIAAVGLYISFRLKTIKGGVDSAD